jgi:hypothetical protein
VPFTPVAGLEAVEAYKPEHGHEDEDNGVVRFQIRIVADKGARDAAMKGARGGLRRGV